MGNAHPGCQHNPADAWLQVHLSTLAQNLDRMTYVSAWLSNIISNIGSIEREQVSWVPEGARFDRKIGGAG